MNGRNAINLDLRRMSWWSWFTECLAWIESTIMARQTRDINITNDNTFESKKSPIRNRFLRSLIKDSSSSSWWSLSGLEYKNHLICGIGSPFAEHFKVSGDPGCRVWVENTDTKLGAEPVPVVDVGNMKEQDGKRNFGRRWLLSFVF